MCKHEYSDIHMVNDRRWFSLKNCECGGEIGGVESAFTVAVHRGQMPLKKTLVFANRSEMRAYFKRGTGALVPKWVGG